jgi:hypothetical protein
MLNRLKLGYVPIPTTRGEHEDVLWWAVSATRLKGVWFKRVSSNKRSQKWEHLNSERLFVLKKISWQPDPPNQVPVTEHQWWAAMVAAGLTNHIWTIKELLRLLLFLSPFKRNYEQRLIKQSQAVSQLCLSIWCKSAYHIGVWILFEDNMNSVWILKVNFKVINVQTGEQWRNSASGEFT